MPDDPPPRTLSTEPPVHVESFATHYTLTWTAGSLAQFLDALGQSASVPSRATAVVDATDRAGRQRRPVRELAVEPSVRYVRVEPQSSWTVSWERRTDPTVSVSGTPPSTVCQSLHRRTTACEGWPPTAVEELDALAASFG